jgi:hypothetical protein
MRVLHNNLLQSLVKEPVENWKNKISNDFEEPVFKEHPELAAIKQQLIEEGADIRFSKRQRFCYLRNLQKQKFLNSSLNNL